MTTKEAWRIERERGNTGEFKLSEADRAKLYESWSVGRVVGSVLGAALYLTAVGLFVKLVVIAWRWILS